MISRELTNIATQNSVKMVIILDGDYRSKIYSFGNMVDEIYFPDKDISSSECCERDIILDLFDENINYKTKLQTYDNLMFPIIYENISVNLYNNYISNKLSHIPYASAVLNAIHEPQHLIALRYPQPVIKSDHYVYSEVEAVEKLIHRKF